MMDEDELVVVYREIVKEILSKYRFHASEKKSFDKSRVVDFMKKSEIIFNDYHFYCSYCQNHFYSQSKVKDINSFFQKHINTDYHKSKLLAENYPDEKPIIEWERLFCTGRCNVCDMGNIEAYFICMKKNSAVLARDHNCIKYLKEGDQMFDKQVLNSLKWFFASKVFLDRFLTSEKENCVECGICEREFVGSVEKTKYHLYDKNHFINLIDFIKRQFGFNIFQIFSCYNLDEIVKYLLCKDFFIKCNNPKFIDDFQDCLEISNSELEFEGFSLKKMQNFVRETSNSIISNNICSICRKPTYEEFHFFVHWKMKNFRSLELENLQKNVKFSTHLEMYMSLANCLLMQGLYVGAPDNPKFDSDLVSVSNSYITMGNNYVYKLVREKLNYIGCYLPWSRRKNFCVSCEVCVAIADVETHCVSKAHLEKLVKMSTLLPYFKKPSFAEPLQIFRNVILCLICGHSLNEDSLFSHMTLGSHIFNYNRYITIQQARPVSKSFWIFMNSCHCIHCGDLMLFSNISSLAEKISKHWPHCCADTQEIYRNAKRFNKTEVWESRRGGVKTDDNSDEMDFQRIQNNMEILFGFYENEIVKKVKNNVRNISPNLNFRSKKQFNFPSAKVESDSVAQISNELVNLKIVKGDNVVNNSYGLNNESNRGSENSEEKNDDVEIEEKNPNQVYFVNNKKRRNLEKTKLKKPEEEFEAVEILFKGKLNINSWREICRRKIFSSASFYFKEDNKLVFGFEKNGLAEAIVLKKPQFSKSKILSVDFTIRKYGDNPNVKEKMLHREIILLLENPSDLVKKMESLVSECVQSDNETEKLREQSVCNVIGRSIRRDFDTFTFHIFGSRMTGLSSPNSDVDVFLECENNYYGFNVTSNQMVRTVGDALKNDQECSNVEMVHRARVPIVRFFHKSTGLMCDVSFKNGLSIYKTKLIQFLLKVDERVKPLLLFLKHWAKLNHLHLSPNFTSYGISLILVFYLQQMPSPILPSVETLLKNFTGCRKTIEGWDFEFSTDQSLLPPSNNKSSLCELLLGFFEFYAAFENEKYVICPLTGTLIEKSLFLNSSSANYLQLPACLLKKIIIIQKDMKSWVGHYFCVLDPLELSHNVMKSFSIPKFNLFKLLCKKSAVHLKKGLNIKQEEKIDA